MENRKRGFRTSTKILLTTAITLIVVGIGLGIAGFAFGGVEKLDGTRVFGQTVHTGTAKAVQGQAEVEEFTSIHIESDFFSMQLVDDEGYYVEYQCEEGWEPAITVDQGTLVVEDAMGQRGGGSVQIDLSGITGGGTAAEPYLRIHCPLSKTYQDVTLQGDYIDIDLSGLQAKSISCETDTSDISASSFSADTVAVSADVGDIYLTQGKVKDLTITNDTGDMHLRGMEVSGTTTVQTQYGDLDVEGGTFGTFVCKGENGEVDLEDVIIQTATTVTLEYGDVEISGVLTGAITIRSEVGDVDLDVTGREADYDYAINATTGEVEVNDRPYKATAGGKNGAKYTIQIDAEYGDVDLDFHM